MKSKILLYHDHKMWYHRKRKYPETACVAFTASQAADILMEIRYEDENFK